MHKGTSHQLRLGWPAQPPLCVLPYQPLAEPLFCQVDPNIPLLPVGERAIQLYLTTANKLSNGEGKQAPRHLAMDRPGTETALLLAGRELLIELLLQPPRWESTERENATTQNTFNNELWCSARRERQEKGGEIERGNEEGQ